MAQVPTKTKMWNAAVGGTCLCFIGSVYSYSMYKMKQGGEEVADEIALHEANMAAAKAAAAAEVRRGTSHGVHRCCRSICVCVCARACDG